MSLFLFAKPRLEGQPLCIKCWIRNNANVQKSYILFCKHRVCREKMYLPKVRKSTCSGSRWASHLKLSQLLRTDQPWVGTCWYFLWYFGDSPYWCVLDKRKTVTLHHTSDTRYEGCFYNTNQFSSSLDTNRVSYKFSSDADYSRLVSDVTGLRTQSLSHRCGVSRVSIPPSTLAVKSRIHTILPHWNLIIC